MSDTASRWLRSYWPEAAWAAFVAVNVFLVFTVAGWETIPFHNVWVSFALIFCLRLWRPGVLVAVLGAIVVLSAASLGYAAQRPEGPGFDELSEVPMMTAMFLVGVWYAWGRKRAMDDLQRAAHREHELLRDVSHHLKTPITIALGHAHLIQTATTGQTAEDAALVVDELGRISNVAERLLLLASAEDERFLARDLVGAGELVREAARRWAGATSHPWRVDIGSDEDAFLGDGERMALAFDCMIENAVKATPEMGSITLSSYARGEDVVLQVADTGIGIPFEDQERIFERFERGSLRGKDSTGGAGLGLALVKAIAVAHGGSVELVSTEGVGTTVRIVLEQSPVPVGDQGTSTDELDEFLTPTVRAAYARAESTRA